MPRQKTIYTIVDILDNDCIRDICLGMGESVAQISLFSDSRSLYIHKLSNNMEYQLIKQIMPVNYFALQLDACPDVDDRYYFSIFTIWP